MQCHILKLRRVLNRRPTISTINCRPPTAKRIASPMRTANWRSTSRSKQRRADRAAEAVKSNPSTCQNRTRLHHRHVHFSILRSIAVAFCIFSFAEAQSGHPRLRLRRPAPSQQSAAAARFRNSKTSLATTGITFTHTSDPSKKYIVESMSGGVILFDYDRDGWPDIYFTNAPTVEMAVKGTKSLGVLYHNNHDGTFTDVTAKSGLSTPLLRHGRRRRRLRQRRLARPLRHLPGWKHPLSQQRRRHLHRRHRQGWRR